MSSTASAYHHRQYYSPVMSVGLLMQMLPCCCHTHVTPFVIASETLKRPTVDKQQYQCPLCKHRESVLPWYHLNCLGVYFLNKSVLYSVPFIECSRQFVRYYYPQVYKCSYSQLLLHYITTPSRRQLASLEGRLAIAHITTIHTDHINFNIVSCESKHKVGPRGKWIVATKDQLALSYTTFKSHLTALIFFGIASDKHSLWTGVSSVCSDCQPTSNDLQPSSDLWLYPHLTHLDTIHVLFGFLLEANWHVINGQTNSVHVPNRSLTFFWLDTCSLLYWADNGYNCWWTIQLTRRLVWISRL